MSNMTQEINRAITIGRIGFYVNGALHPNGEFYGDMIGNTTVAGEDGTIPAKLYISVSKKGDKVKYTTAIESAHGETSDRMFFDSYADMRNTALYVDGLLNQIARY